MTELDRLLAIDIGTQSVRALVFDREGMLHARVQVPIEPPYHAPEPGYAEQDANVFWLAMASACRRLHENEPALGQRIAGLALTAQRATSVFVDAEDEPIGPVISWLDQRRAGTVPALPRLWRTLFAGLGLTTTIDTFQRAAPANWRAAHAPDAHRRTRRAVLLSGYLVHRLTGVWRDSVSAQVGYLPFDYKRRRWASRFDWKWRAVAIERKQLPDLVEPGEPLGALTASAAEALGLARDLPVFSAGADKACEVLGCGAITPETACVSLGTTATINTCRDVYREVTRFVPAYPAAMPARFTDEIQIYRGFWLVSWFKHEFALDTIDAAAREQRAAEALLDERIAPIAPGSDGLFVLPTWSPGVRIPGPEARGAMVGFTDIHTRAHVYRSILEGLAFALREGRERIEKRTKTPITRLRVSGGGSQSDQAMQILADVFALPAERAHTHETSGLGAAINAAVGLGWYADHASAAQVMVHEGTRFEPNPAAVATYDELYREIFVGLYDRLKPVFSRTREILN
ncbi:xylulokinase protein [Salinisphaera shabanensis E1L3A]|uniref:Xylulokinase protein n=1 Tax=Salinisphaera shabanensis E1L3A TaxID=1033802 RepID=U2G3R3_9GAMM|nr:FGGY-family carbohydrate kinase [Salinisphaera shabanensis]ERJ20758.1 xylulokinase protein [Salinisphaera shabanensis E1L3A]